MPSAPDDRQTHPGAARDALPTELDALVTALRAEVPVRAEWRATLLAGLPDTRHVARAEAPGGAVRAPLPGRGRVWRVRPWQAAAAALLCTALGASGAWLAARPEVAPNVAGGVPAASGFVRATAGGAPVVRFVLVAPGARRVTLVGDFNRWDPDATPLRPSDDARLWTAEVPLAPGRHVYGFVVDGALVADPAAPRAVDDDFGVPSSVLLVERPSA